MVRISAAAHAFVATWLRITAIGGPFQQWCATRAVHCDGPFLLKTGIFIDFYYSVI
jgi:hypothetical protein